MKNLPLLLGTAALSLASFFAAVSAEPSVYRYSALKRDKTDYAAIAAGCPNKAIPSDYYTYLQATTYREQDLQRSGDALRLFPWENPIIFDPVASGTHLRPFIDSLYIKEPIPGDSTQYFSLESHFSCHTKPGSSSLTMQGVHLTPIRPANPKISGAVSDPIEGLGNARVQILYAFQDENGSELLLNTDSGLSYRSDLTGGERKEILQLQLETAPFRAIRFGYLEVNLLPPSGYDHVCITSDSVGKTVYLSAVPLQVLAFAPGVLHLQCPFLQQEQAMNAELTCIRGGMLLRSTHRSSQAIARSKYDWYRRHPGLKYQKFEKAKASWSLSSEGRDQSVLLFQTGCDAEQVHLSIRKPTSFDDILASRIFVFHAEPSGDYSFSLLRKGRDGVLRPLKEDPAETPPKYTGGNEAMFRQLAKNTTYPQKAAQEGIEGTVLVSAHIDTDGTLTTAEVYKSVHPLLDEEALRVVRLLKKWEPAHVSGVATKMNLLIPIVFKLQ